MVTWKAHRESGSVAKVAYDTVKSVMLENYESKMAQGDYWREKPAGCHLEHALIHLGVRSVDAYWISQSFNEGRPEWFSLEDLDHAICRLSMMKTLLTASPTSESPEKVPEHHSEPQNA